MLHIHRQSSYLIGRERSVADIPAEHPSLSKQHAVIQYRQILVPDPLGLADTKATKYVLFVHPPVFSSNLTHLDRPYIIDLDSANGTFVNNERIPPSRYYELKLGDAIKFGYSTREYVFMAEEMSLLEDGKEKEKPKKSKPSKKK